MDILARNNVHVSGRGDRAIVFAHGFGCDQNMWRFVAPEFEEDFKVVLFDHVGAGESDLAAYDKAKYSSLHGYANDFVEIGRALRLKDAVFVGHSVSAMIGVLASLKAPDLFGRMVLVGPSARYIDDGDYVGGFSDLFENAPCGYLTIGPDGRITKVNATLTAWTAIEADKFVGRRLHQFLNMAGRIYYETHIAPLLRMQGFFNEFTLDFETAAGERLPVIANAAERRDADGGVVFTAVVLIKATDRRRYERELVESKSALQKGLVTQQETAELREQFIAVLGHDLRNPLAAISAGARILQRSGALKEQKELRVVDMINSTVTRMSDLIDDILDFARGRLGGGISLHRDARPLEPVLEQVIDELRTASPQRLIETSLEITKPVHCDRTRIGQLTSNLIGNALAHGAPDQPVRVGARTEGDEFRLWVANAGDPIPEAAMQRLFEPFFRGEVRNSRQGLGLGLHIASQIAKAHGGRIEVTSTPVETRFIFTMHLTQAE